MLYYKNSLHLLKKAKSRQEGSKKGSSRNDMLIIIVMIQKGLPIVAVVMFAGPGAVRTSWCTYSEVMIAQVS